MGDKKPPHPNNAIGSGAAWRPQGGPKAAVKVATNAKRVKYTNIYIYIYTSCIAEHKTGTLLAFSLFFSYNLQKVHPVSCCEDQLVQQFRNEIATRNWKQLPNRTQRAWGGDVVSCVGCGVEDLCEPSTPVGIRPRVFVRGGCSRPRSSAPARRTLRRGACGVTAVSRGWGPRLSGSATPRRSPPAAPAAVPALARQLLAVLKL